MKIYDLDYIWRNPTIIASYAGSPTGLLSYLNYMVWLEKRHPELIKPEHPEPDLVYEEYRDRIDEEFRNAAEAQGTSEQTMEEMENWSESEKEDYIHAWDEANNMWK